MIANRISNTVIEIDNALSSLSDSPSKFQSNTDCTSKITSATA